ncbi:MAG: hypothetical protein ACYDCK_04625 [Thermoplasmatota archaeon]
MTAPRPLVAVELTRAEIDWMREQAMSQLAEFDRVLVNLEEEEGESAVKWNLARTVKPQAETLRDLVAKLEGAARDAGWRK